MWFTFNINWRYDYTNAWSEKSKVIGLNVVCSEIINSLWKYLWFQQEWHCTSGNISVDLLYLALSSPTLRSHISKILDCHSGTMPLSFTSFLLLLALLSLFPYNHLSFPANVCGRGRSFFNRTIQLAYGCICSCMWSITFTIWKHGVTLDRHFQWVKPIVMTHHLIRNFEVWKACCESPLYSQKSTAIHLM